MKQFMATMLLVAGLCLSGCVVHPGDHGNGNINGIWNATLTDANGTSILTFGTSLVVNGDGSLSVSNFTFTTASPCFVSGETETGSFTLTGDFNGNVTGRFQFLVQSGIPAGNTLTLSGTANGKTISGTWSLNGVGCTGSGKFTMVHI